MYPTRDLVQSPAPPGRPPAMVLFECRYIPEILGHVLLVRMRMSSSAPRLHVHIGCTYKMEQLPEVLCFVISKAATSGKKLSWSVRNIGDTTTVKLRWKPKTLSSSRPLLPSLQGQRLPSATNSNVKKKRSPSSKKRSIQRLRDFLAKKKGQGVKPLAAQESPGVTA